VIRIWKKQKIKKRSSAEAELAGVDDVAPQMLWTRYFMEEQGLKVEELILNQDNLSTMLLEKNGKESSSKHKTYMGQVFLHQGPNHVRGHHPEALPGDGDAWGPLLHKALAGRNV
jgi:hypothetical protein